MRFRSLQQKVAWVALASSVILVVGQYYKLKTYPKWRQVYPPPWMENVFGVLLLLTLLLALASFPRWQSGCAWLAVVWVIFVMLFLVFQGHEP